MKLYNKATGEEAKPGDFVTDLDSGRSVRIINMYSHSGAVLVADLVDGVESGRRGCSAADIDCQWGGGLLAKGLDPSRFFSLCTLQQLKEQWTAEDRRAAMRPVSKLSPAAAWPFSTSPTGRPFSQPAFQELPKERKTGMSQAFMAAYGAEARQDANDAFRAKMGPGFEELLRPTPRQRHMNLLVSDQELAAILAGLRLLAAELPDMQEGDGLLDVLTDAGKHEGLAAGAINELADRLQVKP